MLYEPRESINPRTFALRHALLEELKLRLQRLTGDAGREPLVGLARALNVTYDAPSRRFLVTGDAGASCNVPLEQLRLYEPRDDATSVAWEREDPVLRENRALAARVIDRLLAPSPGAEAP